MTIIHTILLGIIEGLTEFLPISSTAHIDILRALLSIPSSDFVKSFEIIIQLGAILAVVVLYARRVFSSWACIKNLIIAFIPTGIIGFILYKLIKSYLLGNLLVEAWALLIGGIIIILFENHQAKKHANQKNESQTIETLSTKKLLTLGVAQSLAVINDIGIDPAIVNPLGGAIALGHPLGATGAIRTATLLHGLRRRKQKYGMVTMCIGTGMGAAGVFEAL